MPAPAPKTFYVITTRGDVGPYTRAELRDQLHAGAVRAEDRVRNAFGRPLGTVADALSDAVSSGRSPAQSGPPVADPPAHRAAPRRSPAPLIVGLAAAALVGAIILFSALSRPEVPAPTPAPPSAPAAPDLPADTAPVATPIAKPLPDGALPDGWSFLDLGDARPKGKATFAGGTWTLDGGGEDIWGERDECGFVHRESRGDFTMIIRVVSTQNTHEWDKIGMMVRSSLDASSAMVGLTVTHQGRAQFVRRHRDSGSIAGVGDTTVSLPTWLQLTRRGSTYGGYWSSDGTTWTAVGDKQDVGNVAIAAHLGLAVCSHNRSVANRAVFDNVSVTAPR